MISRWRHGGLHRATLVTILNEDIRNGRNRYYVVSPDVFEILHCSIVSEVLLKSGSLLVKCISIGDDRFKMGRLSDGVRCDCKEGCKESREGWDGTLPDS